MVVVTYISQWLLTIGSSNESDGQSLSSVKPNLGGVGGGGVSLLSDHQPVTG